MTDHDCKQAAILSAHGDSIRALTTSVSEVLGHVKRVADLLERTAVASTNIKHLEQEQAAQWKRIDEAAALAHTAADAARDATRDAGDAKKTAAGAAKKADDLAAKPGKIALQYLGIIVTVVITQVVTAWVRG